MWSLALNGQKRHITNAMLIHVTDKYIMQAGGQNISQQLSIFAARQHSILQWKSAVIAVVNMPVYPSVCLSVIRDGIASKRQL